MPVGEVIATGLAAITLLPARYPVTAVFRALAFQAMHVSSLYSH
jgi:hypothetical protein